MRSADVSVIIPAFNCEQWIRAAVDSAMTQTIPPRQIIVIDDGSTDSTAAVLSDCIGRVQVLRQSNLGAAAARNRGLREAQGKFIAFLDADDVWHPRKLERQLLAMKNDESVGLLGTSVFTWPRDSYPDAADGPVSIALVPPAQLAVKNYFATSSVLILAELARRVGDFDVTLRGPEDHDYWLRAAEVAPVGKLPLPLTGYRCVRGSVSKRPDSMEAGMQRILQKLDARDFWRGDRLLRRRAYSYADYSCAYMHGAAGGYPVAIKKLLRSLLHYPLPYRLAESGTAFGRPKRLAVLLLRMLGLMSPDPTF